MAFTPRNVISDISIPAPDFGLMAKSAQAVQTRYLDGFNKAQSYYKSLLNANITSKDNEKYRSEYFKKVNTYLTNISGVDFSNPANVKAATDLFQPLVKDKDFVTDLTWTSMQDAERAKMEEVRTNKNEKIRSQYDPMMEKAMGYSYQDMQNAKRGDGSISKVGVQKFVPFQDIQGMLNKAAKDLKLEVSIDHISGLYKITDKNGENAYPAFLQWARQQMGNKFDEQLLVTGKVKTREQVDALMQGDPNLSKEDAYQQVAKNNSLGIYKNFDSYKNSLDEGIQSIDKRIDEIKSKYNGKIAKNDPNFQLVAQLKKLRDDYKTELGGLNQSKNQDIQTAFDQYMANPEYALLPSLKDGIAQEWAKGYADAKKGRKIEGDKVGLQLQNQKFKVHLESIKNANRYDLEKQKHEWRMDEFRDKELYKHTLKLDLLRRKGKIGGVSRTTEEPGGNVTKFDLRNKKIKELNEIVQTGFLDKSTLEIATASTDLSTTFGSDYVEISKAMKNIIDNWDAYGQKPEANYDFFNDYQTVLKVLKRIDPGIKEITDPGQIYLAIDQGVAQYKGGNIRKRNEVRKIIADAHTSLDELFDDQNEYNQNLRALLSSKEGSGYLSYDYLKDSPSGGLELDFSKLNEDQIADLSEKLIPNADKYDNSVPMVTGFRLQMPKESNWDYGIWDEVLKNAEFVTDNANDTKWDKDKSIKIKEQIAGAGGQLSKLLGADGATASYWNEHNEEYAKITIPVKTVKTDKKTSGKALDTPSGGITFVLTKKKAYEIAQNSNSEEFRQMISGVFSGQTSVAWLDNGLKRYGKAEFPKGYTSRYGLRSGVVEADAIGKRLFIKIDKYASSEPDIQELPIKLQDYMSNPEYWSKVIDKTIKDALEKYDQKETSELLEAQDSHNIAMNSDSDNYISIDDIEALQDENEEQLA